MARRQDRKVIKIEAAYGSDRQTFIIKRNYDLRVRDVQEDAAKAFKIPTDQIILYWKVRKTRTVFHRFLPLDCVFFLQGRNICDTPNELLETLGIENNHTMRVCRKDDPNPSNKQSQVYNYPSTTNIYAPQSTYYPQQTYATYPTQYDQQYLTSPR